VRVIFVIIFALFLTSCATLPQVDVVGIRQGMEYINWNNGIDQEEAIVIAQNYMIDNGFDYDWDVSKAKNISGSGDKKSWSITFSPLADGWGSGRRKSSEIAFQHLMPYFVEVDKSNGSINVLQMEIK